MRYFFGFDFGILDARKAAPRPMASNQAPSPTPESFEAALVELESLVEGLEGGNLSLEGALGGYQRGTELIRYCQQRLNVAQQKIQVLESGLLQDLAIDSSLATVPADSE